MNDNSVTLLSPSGDCVLSHGSRNSLRESLRDCLFCNKIIELRLAAEFANDLTPERKVMKVKNVKWIGLLGALSAGTLQILAGDVVNGGGIIAAALSSVSVFSAQ